MGEQNNFTRRMFIKGMATSFGALPVFAWPRWAQAFYYNLGFFKKGAASSSYVEDVFSTYLYTGNGSTQTITNGIDLAGKGGLVWTKDRTTANGHVLFDTARTATKIVVTNNTGAEYADASSLTAFNNNSFVLGASNAANTVNDNYASWTIRKAAKFFDVVTYTGDGTDPRSISHNLGIAPGMIIIKNLDIGTANAIGDWAVWHRSKSPALTLCLNNTNADAGSYYIGATNHTATTFEVKNTYTNQNTNRYVAYLFAHDAGTDGLIQCGSWSGASQTVTLGWEPQYILFKRTDTIGNWVMNDTARSLKADAGNLAQELQANTSNAESGNTSCAITATGFKTDGNTGTYVYLAIRRGPMKIPTAGTQVYQAVTYTGTGSTMSAITGLGFAPDMILHLPRNNIYDKNIFDRLRGGKSVLFTNLSASEGNGVSAGGYSYLDFNNMDGFTPTAGSGYPNVTIGNGWTYVANCFRRAPGFFDTVCYTGTGADPASFSHNLGVVPELIIIKRRDTASVSGWMTFVPGIDGMGFRLDLNSSAAKSSTGWSSTYLPTATVFKLTNYSDVNASNGTYVAYLFASCPGVSKVGSFTGSASDVTVSCGFSGQPRFVLVKRTDAVGDWIVVDSTRGTSVYLTLNTTSAETSAIVITFTTGGFVAKAGTVANAAAGASYIFMAIA